MSGSRDIMLKMSVAGAAEVRQQLVDLGAQGEAALRRLDAAAVAAAGGSGGGGSSGGMGSLRNGIGQAGFQIQDFVVQVQGGTSALVALSQQGSQMLGIFGPAGAIAGAALTIGLLATQFLLMGNNAETGKENAVTAMQAMRAGAEELAKAIEVVNGLFLTQGERAAQAANATRLATREQIQRQQDIALQFQESSAGELVIAERELGRLRARVSAEERNQAPSEPGVSSLLESEARSQLFSAQTLADNLRADIARSQAIIGRTSDALGRLANAGQMGSEQLGPDETNAPFSRIYSGPAGPDPNITPLRDTSAADARRAEAAARREQRYMGVDVQAALARGVEESSEAMNRLNAEINLNQAGLRGAEGALSSYATSMEALDTALRRGVITEEQFSQSVEGLSTRLGDQIDRVRDRSNTATGATRELGRALSSAFEAATQKGAKLSTIIGALAKDIAAMVTRQAITAPLAKAFGDAAGSINWGSLFSGATASAGGNIMTSSGPLALRRYAAGGIANSPQISIFGEGAGPEAYVPLPDGRSIPVTMRGGGGNTFAPTYQIDARGAAPGEAQRMRAEMHAIAAQSLADFAANINRGGATARLVGRR